jgi:hypothetical protein
MPAHVELASIVCPRAERRIRDLSFVGVGAHAGSTYPAIHLRSAALEESPAPSCPYEADYYIVVRNRQVKNLGHGFKFKVKNCSGVSHPLPPPATPRRTPSETFYTRLPLRMYLRLKISISKFLSGLVAAHFLRIARTSMINVSRKAVALTFMELDF